jgi:hypothetical protein
MSGTSSPVTHVRITAVGSGKSSALAPHIDALSRTLDQMDMNDEHTQHPKKTNDMPFAQPFIISNVVDQSAAGVLYTFSFI